MQNADSIQPLTFSKTPTEREINLIRQSMAEYNREQTELENRIAAAYGVEQATFWSSLDETVAAHFKQSE